MRLVDRHAMGMLSSVMRALKHTEARASLQRTLTLDLPACHIPHSPVCWSLGSHCTWDQEHTTNQN